MLTAVNDAAAGNRDADIPLIKPLLFCFIEADKPDDNPDKTRHSTNIGK